MRKIIQDYWPFAMLAAYFLVGLWAGFRNSGLD
jgi:hypothetical protein